MGKTRLTEEFLQWAAQRNCQVHRGYCESYQSAEPLQPFLHMLRALFGLQHGTSVADAAEAVDTALTEIDLLLRPHRKEYLRALSLDSTDRADKQRAAPEATVAALRDLFASLSARRPLVLFIDDWQWADDASNQVLVALRSLAQRAVLIVLATRGFGVGEAPADARVIELAPLTDSEATETIGKLLPTADPFIAAEIRKHAGGNALFIEELCHSVAHDASIPPLGRLQRGAAWLNQLVVSRVERLPATQGELVRAAAVIGNVIPAWLLERITGYGADHPLVRGLAEQDLLFPGEAAGTLRFKHGIARDVIYDSVGLHTRRAMHLRIAESLQQLSTEAAQEEAYEALAYHFAAGGNTMQAAHYAELAGDKALAASALDRAKTQYRAALTALDQLVPSLDRVRRWVSIAQRLGLVCVFDASRSDLEIFERAVELATVTGEPAAVARAKYWLGYISYSLGEARLAIDHCERALADAQRIGDNPLAVQILATLGEAHTAACNYDRALELLDEAIAVKRRHRSGRRTNIGLAFSLVCRACVLGDRGQFAQAYECFDEAQACIVGTHQIATTTHGWRSAVLLWQGRWEEARAAAAESARMADETRSLFQLSIARVMGEYANWMLERQPAALQAIVEATAWLDPREGGLFRSLNFGWLADGLVTAGRASEARHYAALALLRARKRDLIGVAMAYRALARAAADNGADDAARRYLAQATRIAHARDSAHELAVTRLTEAELALARDDRARAATLLDAAMPAFESMDMRWHLAEAARLRAMAGSRAV
jgi:tetratricopeptide (TPR) repeat protein